MDYWIESNPAVGSGRSGDFAKCVDLAPHRRAIIVGDVAGRGPVAGDGAAVLCAYVGRLVAGEVPLTETMRSASRYFSRTIMTDATPFASLFVAIADVREGLIQYASAGHEPGLLFNSDASGHAHFEPTGPVLGLGPSHRFEQHTLPVFRDGLLVVVTDGITDARRDTGERLSFFGTAGVARAVRDAVLQHRDPALEIFGAAVRHAGGRLNDDACVVVSSLPRQKVDRARLRPAARVKARTSVPVS